jgi:RNA polymerase sigma factor (sigma-70 family)
MGTTPQAMVWVAVDVAGHAAACLEMEPDRRERTLEGMRSEIFDEATTWEAARSGDSAAFGAMFDAHRDRVFGHALRLTRSAHDAEDVTAIVFLETWRRRSAVRLVDGSIVGWLLVTTNHTVRNANRTRRRYDELLRRIPAPESAPDHAEDVNSRLDGQQAADRMRDSFARLSTRDQDVITLCVLEELSIAEAAQTLRVPQGTVKSRLSRAKQRLAGSTRPMSDEPTISEGGAQ